MSFLLRVLLTGFLSISWGLGEPSAAGRVYAGALLLPSTIDLNEAARYLMIDAFQFPGKQIIGISLRQKGKSWYPSMYTRLSLEAIR